MRSRAAAASSPFAPTAPSTPRRAQAQEDYYECLHHKKEFARLNAIAEAKARRRRRFDDESSSRVGDHNFERNRAQANPGGGGGHH